MLEEMDDVLEPTDRSGKSSKGGEEDIVVETDAVLLVNAGVDCVADSLIGGVNDDDDALLLSDNTTGGKCDTWETQHSSKRRNPSKGEWPTHPHTHPNNKTYKQ